MNHDMRFCFSHKVPVRKPSLPHPTFILSPRAAELSPPVPGCWGALGNSGSTRQCRPHPQWLHPSAWLLSQAAFPLDFSSLVSAVFVQEESGNSLKPEPLQIRFQL